MGHSETVEVMGLKFTHWDMDDHIIRTMKRRNKIYEYDLLWTLKRMGLLGVYVDVGAYIGTHTIFFSKYCGAEKVISFEPCKQSFKYLRKNCILNGIPTDNLINAAVSDKDGRCATLTSDESNTGATKIVEGDGNIKCVRLDDCLDDLIVLLKIDVEGMQDKVIRGASKVIETHKPTIVVEGELDKGNVLFLGSLGYTNIGQYCATPTFIWRR